MEEILHEGERISLPGVILEKLTENFNTWFQSQSSAMESTDFLHDKNSFDQMTSDQGIPSSESEILWEAINKVPTTSPKLQQFQQEVVNTPTYKEYKEQVHLASMHSAGGISGLTYGMMKAWPEDIHQSIYKGLCEAWTRKEIPESWRWRWLLPLPKVPDPEITQLRPLCLLEVLGEYGPKYMLGEYPSS